MKERAEPRQPAVTQQALLCPICSTPMWHPRLVLSCACGRQLSCLACGDPAFPMQHKVHLCSDAKQMQDEWSQGSIVHSIASESTSDSTHTTWPHYTGTLSDTESEDDTAFD